MTLYNEESPGAGTRDDSDNGTYRDFQSSQSQSDSVVNAAIFLAGLGYVVGQVYEMRGSVCSCGKPECRTPGKHPVGGDSRSTTDAEKLRSWWATRPDAGIFVNLERSGLVDVSSDSEDTLIDFRKRGLPATVSFESGSGPGHEHYLYRLPEGAPCVRWCKSGVLDLMSAGIAVIPPSVSGKGQYRWLQEPIGNRSELPEAPAWAVAALRDHINREYEAAHIDRYEPPVRLSGSALQWWNGERSSTKPEGGIDRSKTLVTIARFLASAGASTRTIYEALEDRDAELGLRCYTDRNDAERRYAEIAADASINVEPGVRVGDTGKGEFRLVSAEELMNRPDPVWTVKGLLQANTTAAFVGPHGSCKSFAALGLAVSVALGRAWLDFEIRKPGPVVYVVAEGADSFKLRLEALCKELGITTNDLNGKLYFLDHTLYVTDPLQVGKLLLAIHNLELDTPPVMVVLDTLARTYGIGKKENLQEDMSEYVDGMDRLRIALDGSTVLTIHHNNAAGGMRGSTVLPGALSTIVSISADGGQVSFACTKQKDGEEFHEFVAERIIVDLDNKPPKIGVLDFPERTSVVLRKTTQVEGADGLKPNSRKLLRTLQDEPSGELTFTQWRKQAGLAESSAAVARKELVRLGLVVPEKRGRFTYYKIKAAATGPEES